MVILSMLLALLLGIVQFFDEYIIQSYGRYYVSILSFSAGVSVTYVFLHLLPQFSIAVVESNQLLFLALLFGFIFIHLVEKYIYQHSSDEIIDNRLEHVNQSISVIYHIILGFVIFEFAQHGLIDAFLLFIPILIFTAVSTLPLRRHSNSIIKFFGSQATLFGVILAFGFVDIIQKNIQNAFIGFVIGGLIFSVIRHSLPKDKQGKPLLFILGVIIYAPIVLYTQFL
ncbi:MAG: hypothetical protein R6V50_03235 [Thermoplasmatota archaeon]